MRYSQLTGNKNAVLPTGTFPGGANLSSPDSVRLASRKKKRIKKPTTTTIQTNHSIYKKTTWGEGGEKKTQKKSIGI